MPHPGLGPTGQRRPRNPTGLSPGRGRAASRGLQGSLLSCGSGLPVPTGTSGSLWSPVPGAVCPLRGGRPTPRPSGIPGAPACPGFMPSGLSSRSRLQAVGGGPGSTGVGAVRGSLARACPLPEPSQWVEHWFWLKATLWSPGDVPSELTGQGPLGGLCLWSCYPVLWVSCQHVREAQWTRSFLVPRQLGWGRAPLGRGDAGPVLGGCYREGGGGQVRAGVGRGRLESGRFGEIWTQPPGCPAGPPGWVCGRGSGRCAGHCEPLAVHVGFPQGRGAVVMLCGPRACAGSGREEARKRGSAGGPGGFQGRERAVGLVRPR